MMPAQVAVCGPSACSPGEARLAYEIGELLAAEGATLICGGGPGVMAAAARGAHTNEGLVIGIRPDDDASTASPYLSAVVVTGMGEARNGIIVKSADAVIVVGGSWGTMSELALAMRRGGIPVIQLGGWSVVDESGTPVPGLIRVQTPEEAVAVALRAEPSGR
jgi:uncharacterized protein (TIGR00725 family)